MLNFRPGSSLATDNPRLLNGNDKLGARIAWVGVPLTFALVLLVDLLTPMGMSVWVLHIIPQMFALYLWTPAAPLVLALLSSFVMLVTFFTDETGLVPLHIGALNRSLGVFVIWSCAIVGFFFIRFKLAMRAQGWLQVSQTELNEALSGDHRLEELGDILLKFMAERLGSIAGAAFAQRDGRFQRIATYAVPAGAVPASFEKDEGLLGQAVSDYKSFYLDPVPEGYLSFGSAFGKSVPRCLYILPVWSNRKVNGVLELGFHKPLDMQGRQFLERTGESISIALRSASYRTHLQNLLEETQRQKEQLQTQEEELRVSNEELEEQSRSLQESQQRLEQQQAELEQTNAHMEEQTQLLVAQKAELQKAQRILQVHSRELEQASQYKSDFLANMSHELRTPLNSTLILAKLLADNAAGNLTEEQVRYAETIQSSGNDLLALINDILDLSKIEAGHMEIQPESLRIGQLVRDLVRMFEPQAEVKGIDFKVELSEEAPAVLETDGKRLEQVLKNLLSNALKFTERGEVRLLVAPAGEDQLVFQVRDTGIGIPREQHEAVFEAFRQADGTTNRKYGGTGLGLSISRQLSRLLGGRIELQSEVGEGSTFSVYLPLRYDADLVPAQLPPVAVSSPDPEGTVSPGSLSGTASAEKRDSAADESAVRKGLRQAQPAARSATGTVRADVSAKQRQPFMEDDRERLNGRRVLLVVEDDRAFARILYDLAHELNFHCLLADTADDALAIAHEYQPHAVILDVGLPDHSGLSVLDQLKQNPRTRHIPVHVVSAEDYSQKAFSLGAMGYLLKPVQKSELTEALKNIEERLKEGMRRILVVEDDPVQRDSVKKLLATVATETVGVGTAAECLTRLRNESFDCVVLDLSLPDASGTSLLQTLSEEERDFPPVIVYTGRDLSPQEEEQLRRYSKSIIIKGAKSPERLLDEVTLFLHQVVADLPAEQQRMLRQARSRDAALEGRRILVVEDDIRNVFALSNILEPRGASVLIARNGREALDLLERQQSDPEQAVDLVLMDVMMPEMDGLTATRTIRQRAEWRKLPIIMLTAKAMKGDQQNCLDAGANDYMAKPLDVDKLLSLVRVWLPR